MTRIEAIITNKNNYEQSVTLWCSVGKQITITCMLQWNIDISTTNSPPKAGPIINGDVTINDCLETQVKV